MKSLRPITLALTLVLAGALVYLVGARTGAAPWSMKTSLDLPQLPAAYAAFQDAREEGDVAALLELAESGEGYVAYLSAVEVAHSEAAPTDRLRALERALALRIDDPLRRAENERAQLLRGELALLAGNELVAREAFRSALPAERAAARYVELEPDPYRRAAAFQNAGLQARALEELGELAAPSIEAPALRALGRYEEALAAYRRWLLEAPTSEAALLGEAWCLFYLHRNEEAEEAFSRLGPAGEYGLGLLANRAGRISDAVTHLVATGRADLMWLATSLLEARDRFAEALPIYLEIAGGATDYADDAAYRAYVLASRLGHSDTAQEALSLLPPGSFFALTLGGEPQLPARETSEEGSGALSTELAAAAAELAGALTEAGWEDAATGELLFALREAEAAGDAAASVEVAQLLQGAGEYRQSVRAARALLGEGGGELRVWRLAYPPAWPEHALEEAALSGVEPALVWAVMRQESAFSEVAVSRSGALGLMQVMPTTWEWIAELRSEEPREPFDIRANIAYGATYLAWLVNYFEGDLELAIAGYNGGQGYVRRLFESEHVNGVKDEFYREIDQPETREYLQRVYENLAIYRALYPEYSLEQLVKSAPGE